MSQQPIDRSPDLRKLRNEGYDLEVVAGYLVVRDVPYLRAKGTVDRGILVCALTLAANIAAAPTDHTAYFVGAHPCNADGSQMTQIVNSVQSVRISDGITTSYYLSAKPKPRDSYVDFHEKVTTYIRRLSEPAEEIDPGITAKTFPVIRAAEEHPAFLYVDTASSRADIVEVTKKLELSRIAIIGLGGTGAYILDFVAKTPVRQIHLFDGDKFLQHNAFRGPGAASLLELEAQPYKVDYYHAIYAKMRKGIIPHHEFITEQNLDKLAGIDFVFLSMDAGPAKKAIVRKLLELNIPFVDVGMGIYLRNNALGGTLRTTTATAAKQNHLAGLVSMSGADTNNEYDKNIQIAELNALHAAFAVIKWKKLFGFHADQRHEHHSTYSITRNEINNEERA
jgi:hypothetical protein